MHSVTHAFARSRAASFTRFLVPLNNGRALASRGLAETGEEIATTVIPPLKNEECVCEGFAVVLCCVHAVMSCCEPSNLDINNALDFDCFTLA